MIRKLGLCLTALMAFAWADGARAEGLTTTVKNNYGVPSQLIDLPTAEFAPDGELAVTVTHQNGFTRNTATFQVLPWLTGSFRYVGIRDLNPLFNIFYDRSFDVRIRLFEETETLPAIAIGLQDFLGTGILSSEYIVATKQIGNRLRVTGGLGFGRLGTRGSFATVFRDRPTFDFGAVGEGGDFRFTDYFSGDVALFGGLSYQVTSKISVSAEYSSDNFELEQQQGVFDPRTPFSFGVNYNPSDSVGLRVFALNGAEIGASLTLALNVRNPPFGNRHDAPFPVAVRDPDAARDLGWTLDANAQQRAFETLKTLLKQDAITLEGAEIGTHTAHLRIRNGAYLAEAQALGRTFRIMSRALPASIETFHITVVNRGLVLMTTTYKRSDLERFENSNEQLALAAAEFSDSIAFGDVPEVFEDSFPAFTWRIQPFFRFFTFDPDNPFRADVRLRFGGEYEFDRGWVLTNNNSVRLFGNLDEVDRPSNSVLPRVRSEIPDFNAETGPTIDELHLTKYARLGKNLYGRVTGGILELQYAGASGEVLWKPFDSRLALGVELNYVRLRTTSQRFGIASRETAGGVIPEFNGHMSAYYEFKGGFDATVHAGRYLAGDWGATLEVARRFANGWRIGAFATRTNVSAAEFGEGSFDKGIFFTVPLAWALGNKSKQTYTEVIRPLQRDGGQRVNVATRLNNLVRESHRGRVADSWGRFWR